MQAINYSDRDYCAPGDALKQQGKLSEAVACYQAAMQQYPESPWVHFHLGQVLQQQGEINDAIACYQQVIRLQPDFAFVYAPLRYAPLPAGSPLVAELVVFYRQMIETSPQVSLLSSNLAALLTKQNRVEDAIPFIQIAIQQQTLAAHPEWAAKTWDLSQVQGPDFIIIGAPRCGTTSLYRYLASHPQILAAAEKEIRFFSQEFDRGLEWYLAHFPPIAATEPYMTGEATPTYLAHPQAAQRLQQCFPRTKLIVMLRNPIDRAFSHYQMLVRRGTEQRSFETAIAQERQALADATDATLEQGCYWRSGDYLTKSLYVHHLRRWLTQVDRERVLIVQSEVFYNDPAATLQQIFAFLGLPNHALRRYPKYNAAPYSPLQAATFRSLSEYFAPYNQQLETELQRSFAW